MEHRYKIQCTPFYYKYWCTGPFFCSNYPRIRGWYQARAHPFSSGNGKGDSKPRCTKHNAFVRLLDVHDTTTATTTTTTDDDDDHNNNNNNYYYHSPLHYTTLHYIPLHYATPQVQLQLQLPQQLQLHYTTLTIVQ